MRDNPTEGCSPKITDGIAFESNCKGIIYDVCGLRVADAVPLQYLTKAFNTALLHFGLHAIPPHWEQCIMCNPPPQELYRFTTFPYHSKAASIATTHPPVREQARHPHFILEGINANLLRKLFVVVYQSQRGVTPQEAWQSEFFDVFTEVSTSVGLNAIIKSAYPGCADGDVSGGYGGASLPPTQHTKTAVPPNRIPRKRQREG